MSNLTHITTCVLCDPENQFRASASGFEQLNLANPQFPTRVLQFLGELYTHLQKTADLEGKRMAKLHKGSNGMNLAEAQQFVLQHGKHIAAFQAVLLSSQWAQGFSILNAFDTTDPAILDAKDGVRVLLHSFTARRIPDDTIRSGIAELGFVDEDADSIFQLIRVLLDASNGVRPQQETTLITP